MTITDPAVIKKIQDAKLRQKADYQASKGRRFMQEATVTICGTCKTHLGTFQWAERRDKDGNVERVQVHVNCPGPQRKTPPGFRDEPVPGAAK